MLIDVRRISKIYNEGQLSEVRALDDVSLQIDYGEFTTIWGQSGSGKSTLMNILGCLDLPTYGEYLLDGEPVNEMPMKKLSTIRNHQIGFIFQGFNLIPSLTALENVELPLIYRGMPYNQQQRVAIARAIAASPPIIMADEPTGNLDSRSGAEIMQRLADLNEQGSTIILITHDLRLARAAKRIITIHDGHVIGDEAVPEEQRREALTFIEPVSAEHQGGGSQ